MWWKDRQTDRHTDTLVANTAVGPAVKIWHTQQHTWSMIRWHTLCNIIQRTDILCDLCSIKTGMVVTQQLLEKRQPPCFKVLSSSEDFIHVLHVFCIVCVQLVQWHCVGIACGLYVTPTSLDFLCHLLHLPHHQATRTVSSTDHQSINQSTKSRLSKWDKSITRAPMANVN